MNYFNSLIKIIYFLMNKIVGDIALIILKNKVFIITPLLNVCTSQDSNLYFHPYRGSSSLSLVQKFVGFKNKLF